MFAAFAINSKTVSIFFYFLFLSSTIVDLTISIFGDIFCLLPALLCDLFRGLPVVIYNVFKLRLSGQMQQPLNKYFQTNFMNVYLASDIHW